MRVEPSNSRPARFFIALLAFTALLGCSPDDSGRTTTSADASRSIYALGRIEPASGIIAVSAVPGERLKELDPDVAVNQRVPGNGILGLLASYDLGKAQLHALMKKKELAEKNRLHQIAVTEAQKAQAAASLAQAEAKLKELELQRGKLNSLETASLLANEKHMQLESLQASDPELVTDYQLRKQRNELDAAMAEHTIASKSYDSARDAAEKTVAAAKATKAAAELSLDQLQQGLEEQAMDQEIEVARETLKRSVILSPNISPESLKDVLQMKMKVDHKADSVEDRGPYTVLKIYVQPGEFITQTPIMQVGDLSSMVCIAEVYEADVKNIQLDQPVTIRSPAFSGEFADKIDSETKERQGGIAGRVVQIGGVIGSPGLTSRNPLAPADRSVVDVRIAIDDPAANAELASRVGLQVTVEFDTPEGTAEAATYSKPAPREG